jgi:hypothetical protein
MAIEVNMRFIAVALLFAGFATADSFTYNNFSSVAGLTLNGDATQVIPDNVLRLVHNAVGLAGTAYRTTPIAFDATTDFSTAFEFDITTDTGNPTDGFTFLLQNENVNAVGGTGQGSGYVGISPSVAVLFRGRGPSFIDVVTDGVDPLPYPPPGATTFAEGVFYNRDEFAWIDYNPISTILSVYLSTSSTKPLTPVMSTTVDVFGTLGAAQPFVGFSAGTGLGTGDNDILNWSFSSSEVSAVPEPASIGLFALVLVFTGLRARAFRR